jgi:hypothetical protein
MTSWARIASSGKLINKKQIMLKMAGKSLIISSEGKRKNNE